MWWYAQKLFGKVTGREREMCQNRSLAETNVMEKGSTARVRSDSVSGRQNEQKN